MRVRLSRRLVLALLIAMPAMTSAVGSSSQAAPGDVVRAAGVARNVARPALRSAAVDGAAITLSPTQGSYTLPVTVTGSGFGPGERVRVYWDSTTSSPLTSATADGAGGLTAVFIVPSAVSGGHTVIAVGQTTGLSASAPFTIVPKIFVLHPSGYPGTVNVLTGAGFGPNEPVAGYWNAYPGGLPLGSSTTNALGSFSGHAGITFTIPYSPTGSYPIIGVGRNSQKYDVGYFILSAPQNDFHEIAWQGFGDPENDKAWSMAWYQNKLYVGTGRAQYCVEQYVGHLHNPKLPYPPHNPHLTVPCNPDPQALPLAAQIWALDPTGPQPLTQTNWTEVYSSPYTVPVFITDTNVITMAPRDMGFRGMSVYDDVDGSQALYISGVSTKPMNGYKVPPPSLLRTTDGISFTAVPADPGTVMGDINLMGQDCCIRGQANYQNHLYIVIGSYEGAGSVFASADPRKGDNSFHEITPPGMQAYEIGAFNGHLYVGTSSLQGYTVLQTDCTTPPPGSLWCPNSAFTQIVPPGGGLGAAGDATVMSMHVFTDSAGVPHLYVGAGDAGAETGRPGELIRINPDDSWDLVVGDPRQVNGVMKTSLSGLQSGFGFPYNNLMDRVGDYNGELYVGTGNFSVNLIDKPIGKPLLPYMGFHLWKSADGVNFTPVTQNGFGDPFSTEARSIQGTPYGLFVASANNLQGLRVWQGT